MIIINKYLNISTEDVNKETDIFVLKQWLLEIEENIITMGIAIERTPDIDENQQWLNKIKSAKKLQSVLKQQVIYRISLLKNKRTYQDVLISLLKEEISEERFIELSNLAKTQQYG